MQCIYIAMAYRCQYESFSNLVSRRDILQGIDSVHQKEAFRISEATFKTNTTSNQYQEQENVEKSYEKSVAHQKLQYTPESFEPCGRFE